MFGLDTTFTLLLILCLVAACAFEFINGFHDTANAVATVIYTHSLKPAYAVMWSGFWNFVGVNVGGIAVAIGIINLLPMEILVDQNLSHNIAMILSLILTAIIWNLATWYLGLPCSSSHTLLGSIFGVGLAFMLLPGSQAVALNWGKISDVGLSLLISPVFGFGMTFLLVFILKKVLKNKELFHEPAKKAPPSWIRGILILTCTSVSFSHGSNDGQKGVGLIMLILIAFAPIYFSIDRKQNPSDLFRQTNSIEWTLRKIDTARLAPDTKKDYNVIMGGLSSMKAELKGKQSYDQIEKKNHFKIRKAILQVSKKIDILFKENDKKQLSTLSKGDLSLLRHNIKELRSNTEYAPTWVILMVSLSLGLGTMIGWKRIVVTIGERIGKTHLTYAQGASAEFIAASTISVSTMFGLPVSTTHVLSSGVAGAMFSGGGRQNLQINTVRNILLAWLITLPATILMSGSMFLLLRMLL